MAQKKQSGFSSLAKEHALYPKEAPLKVREGKAKLQIGLPVEKELQETRIALSPDSVAILCNNGIEVIVESEAGNAAKFSDREYSEAGARIVYSNEEAFQADIVLKVEPPSLQEIGYMKQGANLISAIQMANLEVDYLHELNRKKISAAAFEFIEDKGAQKPIVRSMSEIAGNCIVSIAAEYLSNVKGGIGVILGGVAGVPPSKVVILGAGTIAECVTRAVRGMGAEVRIFDNHHHKLRRIRAELGEHVYTSIIDPAALSEELKTADLAVGSLRSTDGTSVCVVTEEMVAAMKPDSIIIDASITNGGNFETSMVTTLKSPVFKKHDVTHYCVPNIPSRVGRTASIALSHILTPILINMSDLGGFDEMIYEKSWFRIGVYAYNGSVTKATIGKKFGLQHKELDLLIAARF